VEREEGERRQKVMDEGSGRGEGGSRQEREGQQGGGGGRGKRLTRGKRVEGGGRGSKCYLKLSIGLPEDIQNNIFIFLLVHGTCGINNFFHTGEF
jgi:hypothetical protein